MKATPEQQTIIDYVQAHDGLVKSSAVAGSGKTTLLVAVAKTLEKDAPKKFSGLYLAYNKAIATEASTRFPKSVQCCTTHSLAYRATVVEHNLRLGFFNYRTLSSEKLKYDHKCAVVDYIKEFCLSRHTTFNDFATDMKIPEKLATLCNKYLGLMESGKIDCTHDFYLKMFHILLAEGHIKYSPFNFIALDEAGDLNEVTFEIFKHLPAAKKMLVGDPHQNIYQFNHTINCFDANKDEGITLPMSQSFRVSDKIATQIEAFCRLALDAKMSFKGIKIEDNTIKTRAFISRTNSALIGKMMELNKLGIQYGLTRTPKQIFALPLALCSLRHRGFISLPEYKHIQDDVNHYYESKDLMYEYKSVLAYLRYLYDDDLAVQNALNVIMRHGKPAIIECYEEACKHTNSNQAYTLGTSHSTKGLEFDEVIISDDLNTAISPIMHLLMSGLEPHETTPEMRGELNLYYVATSRAKKKIKNAIHLPTV